MSNANAVGGIAYLKIDGVQYDLRGNAKYSPGDIERESVAGMDGVHGYKEMVAVPYIEMDLTDRPTIEIKKLQALNDVTVTLELINGKAFTLRNAWYVTRAEMDAAEGQMTVRFEGKSGEEVV